MHAQLNKVPSIIDQCITEQTYVRHSMMRSLLYVQVRAAFESLGIVEGYWRHSRATP